MLTPRKGSRLEALQHSILGTESTAGHPVHEALLAGELTPRPRRSPKLLQSAFGNGKLSRAGERCFSFDLRDV